MVDTANPIVFEEIGAYLHQGISCRYFVWEDSPKDHHHYHHSNESDKILAFKHGFDGRDVQGL